MADRGDPEDPAALDVKHGVPAHDRILPVGHEDRAVRSDSNVAGPEDRIGARHCVLRLHRVASAIGAHEEGLDQALARLGMQQLVAVLGRQQFPFVEHQPGRRSRSGAGHVRQRSGPLLVKVRAPILAPAPAAGTPVAEVGPFHHIQQAGPLVAVIIVVGLPDRAEGVQRNLVGIAGIVGKHAKITAIGLNCLHGGGKIGPFAAAAERLAGAVRGLEALISGLEVVAPVMPEQHGVQAVVVIDSVPAAEQRLLRDDPVVLVLGVNEEIRRLGNDDLVAEHGDAERSEHVGVLVEDLAGIRLPVAVSILENDDAVALLVILGTAPEVAAVVDRFDEPDPSSLVDVEIGRVDQQRLAGPKRHLQPGRDLEFTADGRRRHTAGSQCKRHHDSGTTEDGHWFDSTERPAGRRAA